MPRFALLVAIVLGLLGCTSLLFYPTRQLVLTPDQIGLWYRDVWFQAKDGIRLHGWFLPATGGSGGTVLFLHGNAENISTHIPSVAWLPGEGFNVFMFDYRGFGLSKGSPSLDGLHRDIEAALEEVFTLDGVDPNRVVVFGQSLGGALAITALSRSPQKSRVRALIVEGAFSSYRRIAREKLAEVWFLWPLQTPLSWTLDDRYKPIEAIPELSPIPVLIIEDLGDQIIPPGHAEALFSAAKEPKTLWRIVDAGHIFAFQSPENRRRLIEYLRACAFGGAC